MSQITGLLIGHSPMIKSTILGGLTPYPECHMQSDSHV